MRARAKALLGQATSTQQQTSDVFERHSGANVYEGLAGAALGGINTLMSLSLVE